MKTTRLDNELPESNSPFVSYIFFLKDKVYFDANGYFDPLGVRWEVNMAQNRITDMLPYDYSTNH
jgi:hypothetical protein